MPTSASAASSANAPAETSLSGSTQMTSAAASGRTIRSVVMGAGSPNRHEDDGEDGDARRDRKCVCAEEPGLRARNEPAEVTRVLSERVRGLVDQWVFDRAVEALRGPDCRAVEERVIQLVEVELVLEDALHERVVWDGVAAGAAVQPGHVDAAEAEEQRQCRRRPFLPVLRADGRFRRGAEP